MMMATRYMTASGIASATATSKHSLFKALNNIVQWTMSTFTKEKILFSPEVVLPTLRKCSTNCQASGADLADL